MHYSTLLFIFFTFQAARIHGYDAINVIVVETHSLVVGDDGVMHSSFRHRAFANLGMAQIMMPYNMVRG